MFRLVVLPDTQCYALRFPDVLQAQGDFVLDYAGPLSIRAAIHLGDITEHNVSEQWEVARRALSPLYDHMPLVISPGNHDLGAGGSALDRSSSMEVYFPPEDARVAPGFIALFEDGTANSAWQVSGDLHDYLLIGLEFAPRAEVVRWAAGVLAAHPSHIAILSTHAYLDGDGRRYDRLDDTVQPYCPYDYGVTRADGTDGEELFRQLVAPSTNVRLVLSGHVPNGFAHSVDVTQSGAAVHQVLVDYQTGTVCPETGGDGGGYLLLLELDEHPDGVDVVVRSYSPWEVAARPDHELRFTLDPA